MDIPILYDELYCNLGIKKYICWNPACHPHALVTGTTGSGKTVLLKLIIGKTISYCSDTQIFLLNYKADDAFAYCKGSHNYYEYNNCLKGIEIVYDMFSNRLSGNTNDKFMILCIIDEYSSFLNSLEKKKQEEVKQKLAAILQMGRSLHVHIVLSTQRPDAALFSNGARDCLTYICALGSMSSEGLKMCFPDGVRENIHPETRSRGNGYLYADGMQLKIIQVPIVKNMELLNQCIYQGLNS